MDRLFLGDLDESNLYEKKVLVRVDLNVPLAKDVEESQWKVANDTKIIKVLPTINYLISKKAKIILCSHLGRPSGKKDLKYSLLPVVEVLYKMLNKQHSIHFVHDCVGETVKEYKDQLKPGEILLLENLRFHEEEEKNGNDFAKELAEGVDVYVNDAFACSHRAHASIEGVTKHVQLACAGLLLKDEITFFMDRLLNNPQRPLAAVVGGAKVSSKIGILHTLLTKLDKLLIGGAMVYTFYKAMGFDVGDSLVEDDCMDIADSIMKLAEDRKLQIILAKDSVVKVTKSVNVETSDNKVPPCDVEQRPSDASNEQERSSESKPGGDDQKYSSGKIIERNDKLRSGLAGVDIGPQTIELFAKELKECGTILWNGPVGMFENPDYCHGTDAIIEILSQSTHPNILSQPSANKLNRPATTIACGGETLQAVDNYNVYGSSAVRAGGSSELLGKIKHDREYYWVDSKSDSMEEKETAKIEKAVPSHICGQSSTGHAQFSFVSTGGGAALELLEGKNLPGIMALRMK